MKRKHWYYNGDVNLENGGVFYNLDNWKDKFVEAVRVEACTNAGGPSNLFWVERIVVLIPDSGLSGEIKLQSAMSCVGLYHKWLTGGEYDVRYLNASAAQKRHMVVDACLAYGYYDPDDCHSIGQPQRETVQIGPDDKFFDFAGRGWAQPKEIKRLRDGTNLRNYVRREWLNT